MGSRNGQLGSAAALGAAGVALIVTVSVIGGILMLVGAALMAFAALR